MYVYRAIRRIGPTEYEVGFYQPNGDWYRESHYDNMDDAAKRVHYLNGGSSEILEHIYWDVLV